MGPVLTHIVKRPDVAFFGSNNNNTLALNVESYVVSRTAEFFLMTDKLPGSLKNLLFFHFKKLWIGVANLVD